MPDPLQVLCVDDDSEFLALTADLLAAQLPEASITTAVGVEAAMTELSGASFDCIVSDYEMPGETGLDFLRSLRARGDDRPFILFTGKGSEAVASEAISAGADDYLQKETNPEQFELLANRIQNSVSKSRVESDLANTYETLEQLHATALDLRDVESRTAAYERAMEAANFVLEFDICGFFEVQGDVFEPIDVRNMPVREEYLSLTSGLAGEVYQAGESRLVADVQAAQGATPIDESFRGCLTIPIGDHGVFQAISETPGAFSERDREHAELLISHLAGTLDRLSFEAELERTTEQLETVLANTSAHIYLKDSDGRYELVNDAFANRLGRSREEIVGRTDADLQDDAVAAEVQANDERVLASESVIEAVESANWDGQEREYYSVKTPVFDDDGVIQGVCGVSTDITDLKDRERALQAKSKRLNEFASVVSHDLRSPLAVAQGYVDLLAADGANEEHLSELEQSLSRMQEIIEELLALARSGMSVADPESVDVAEIADRAWTTVSTTRATLLVDIDRTVEADPQRLTQLFENLFRNAVEHGTDVATNGGSEATIEIRVEAIDGGFAVSDTGTGLPQEPVSTLTEPGYSTDEDGTGFGLSIVERIAEAHGWELSVPDTTEGARFEFTI